MHINIAWQDINTVLLDMDDTLLDLAFDNYLWQKSVPETYGAKQGTPPQEVQDHIRQRYHAVQHTLNWYHLDYWNERLDLDTCAMTTKQEPCTVLREDTVPFLDTLEANGKRRILPTSAHPYNLAVKPERTGLASHPDLLLSAHTSGYPKEDQWLQRAVAEETGMSAKKALFIDDDESILNAIVLYSIRYCFGVANPDSGITER